MDDSRTTTGNQNASDAASTDSTESIDWLAFQYISGEMSTAETASFEASLATNTAACEAVARQVMICESVATAAVRQSVAPQTVAPTATIIVTKKQPAADRSQTSVIAVAVCAACMALAVWIGISQSPSSQTLASADQSPETELVRGWVEAGFGSDDLPTLSVDSLAQLDGFDDIPGSEIGSVLDSVTEFSDDKTSGDNLVPDWMFAAVEFTDDSDLPEENWE